MSQQSIQKWFINKSKTENSVKTETKKIFTNKYFIFYKLTNIIYKMPKYGLFEGDGDLEFLSKEWVAEGEKVLQQLAKEFASSIKNVTFSITECAFAPPGHLLREEDHDICIGWSFWIENGQITVEDGGYPSKPVDQRIEFDYEVAFPGVRMVYSTMKPEELKALAKARAKAAPKNGPKGPQTPPELQDMLMKLHDTLAPRTMPRFDAYSKEWITVLNGYLQKKVQIASKDPVMVEMMNNHKGQFIFCEKLTDPPLNVSSNGEPTGFYMKMKDGTLTGHRYTLGSEGDQADQMILMDYYVNNPVGGMVIEGRSEQSIKTFQENIMEPFQKLMKVDFNKQRDKPSQQLFGKLLEYGEMETLHDFLARHTRQ